MSKQSKRIPAAVAACLLAATGVLAQTEADRTVPSAPGSAT